MDGGNFVDGAGFNTQPPEGGCPTGFVAIPREEVSTHSRLKAAANSKVLNSGAFAVSTHSRLKAAGQRLANFQDILSFQHTAA